MELHEMENDALLNQAAGCLVGVAVGDALGGPLERMTADEISSSMGVVKEMTGGGNLGLEPGETTDDTAQTIALAESILECGLLNPADAAHRLAEWYRQGGRGVGRHSALVLSKIAGGEDWELASLEVQAANPGSAGNGSLMRCSPVALLRRSSVGQLIEESRLSSRITHPHAECQWACAFLNLVIAELLAGSQPRRAIEKALWVCNQRGDAVASVLERAEDAAASIAIHTPPSGYVLDTLECALWSLLNHNSFEETVVASVNLGGDADTIGAVTGAVAGAAYGLNAIPDRWLVHIRSWWRLQELAIGILEVV